MNCRPTLVWEISSPVDVTDGTPNSTPTFWPAASFRLLAQALWLSPESTTRFLSSVRAVFRTCSRAAEKPSQLVSS